MQEELVDVLLHAVVFVGYTVASALFAGFGVLFEYRGYLSIAGGDTFVAAWIGFLGLVMLGLSYLIITDKATVALSELQATL